ncbi:hypothetical protein TruAng_005901 [Truncatella angustata]|nr:hypothetical protein TruAng_005901 [Truncatella angustata]
MVTSSEDGTVKIWETRSGTIQRSYNHGSPVNDVVIHPNQGEIISCDRSGSVRIWDLAENNCSHQLIPEEDVSVSSVTVASDGSLLCAANNAGNVFVWALIQRYEHTDLMPVTYFPAHKEYITRILLSPDVKKLATCSADHTAKIWEVIDVDPADQVPLPTRSSSSAAPTNGIHSFLNGTAFPTPSIVSPSDHDPNNEVPVKKPKPYPLEATLQGHQRWVWDCAFSADSAYLVTACSDHYARLWELHSQQVIRQYNGHHRGADGDEEAQNFNLADLRQAQGRYVRDRRDLVNGIRSHSTAQPHARTPPPRLVIPPLLVFPSAPVGAFYPVLTSASLESQAIASSDGEWSPISESANN